MVLINMDKIRTTGVIEQTIYGDTGTAMYLVNVELNENIVKAQSINYSSKTKTLPDGEKSFCGLLGNTKRK